jgi:DNA replication protein DnaC
MNELTRQIEAQLRALNLKGMLPVYRELSERATKGNLQYEEYLALLLGEELNRKTEGSIRAKIGKAKFPFVKTVEEFDFSFQPGLREREVINLCSLEFIEQEGNAFFLGTPGVSSRTS